MSLGGQGAVWRRCCLSPDWCLFHGLDLEQHSSRDGQSPQKAIQDLVNSILRKRQRLFTDDFIDAIDRALKVRPPLHTQVLEVREEHLQAQVHGCSPMLLSLVTSAISRYEPHPITSLVAAFRLPGKYFLEIFCFHIFRPLQRHLCRLKYKNTYGSPRRSWGSQLRCHVSKSLHALQICFMFRIASSQFLKLCILW